MSYNKDGGVPELVKGSVLKIDGAMPRAGSSPAASARS